MTQDQSKRPKIGIIAGGGDMPGLVAQEAIANGRDVHILGIVGDASPEIENFPHTWFKLGQFGKLFKILNQQNCKDVVLIGSVKRPDMKTLHFDLGAIKLIPFVLSLTVGGDDSVLSRIVKYFEKKGFSIRGAHEVAPGLLADEGCLTKRKPSTQDLEDIKIAINVVKALGQLDVGQAAVVAKGYTLAVEAAEGTDAMLSRCADLKQWGSKDENRKIGVLVKCPKPGQEKRIDMPTIGVQTIDNVADAGLAGIAVSAEAVLFAGREDIIRRAAERDIFVVGVNINF